MSSPSEIVTNLHNSTVTGSPPPAPSQQLGKNDFMKLLMTQLQQQDPMNPADSTQFVAQLAQFSSLEQATQTNDKLDSLINAVGVQSTAGAVSMLGKQVTVQGNQMGGPTTVSYNLTDPLQAVQITVRDASGATVKVLGQQATSVGKHSAAITGIPSGGHYTVTIQGVDGNGKQVDISPAVTQKVTGVSFSNGQAMLDLDSGVQVPATSVLEIDDPVSTTATSPAAAAPATTTSGVVAHQLNTARKGAATNLMNTVSAKK